MAAAAWGDLALSEYARKQIAFHARKMSRWTALKDQAREDLEQELRLCLCRRAGLYDPSRATPETFVDRVLRSAAATMLRDRFRLKRNADTPQMSVDAPVDTSGDGACGMVPSEEDGRRHIGATPADSIRLTDLRHDIQFLLARLPALERSIAEMLKTGKAEAVVASDLGLSRRQVRNACERIREVFRAHGLGPDTPRGQPTARRRK